MQSNDAGAGVGRAGGRDEVPGVEHQVPLRPAKRGSGNVSLAVVAADEDRYFEKPVALSLDIQYINQVVESNEHSC